MSSSVVFTGAGFFVTGASQVTPGTVRVSYSSTPKASSPLGADDALNPVNYVLSGPGPYSIASVQPVSGDPLSVDILLASNLVIGTWTVAVSNVTTPAANPLVAPTSAQFAVTTSSTLTPLAGGAENDDAEKIIRKHLSPAMQGPNWEAMIAALATGDDTNWDNARAAFDQLFLSTASGLYLDRRASDQGVKRPANVGISDELFRKLAVKTSTKKLVHEAIREILEIYYGRDSLRAYVECTVDENYNLTGNPTLSWTLDEKEEFTHTFDSDQFGAAAAGKANEVAFALTKTMRDLGSNGFAVATQHPETGLNRVRIYSGSLGLGSYARVTGGSAQNILKFPTEIDTYNGEIDTSFAYSWVYTQPDQDTTRISLTKAAAGLLIDLSGVKEGDYVIIGEDAQIGSTGTYEVLGVGISWSGANLVQYFDIERIAFAASATQASNDAYRFYRPTKRSTAAADGRTVVVAQTTPGKVDISIPATTQAVTRGPYTGAYLKSQEPIDVARIQRLPDGTATIQTAGAHGLTGADVGKQILLDGSKPSVRQPFVSSGVPSTIYPDPWTYAACHTTITWPTQTPPDPATQNGTATVLSNGQVFFTGGYLTAGSIYAGETVYTNRYQSGATSIVSNASEADGATIHTHTWIGGIWMSNPRQYHAASVRGTGAMVTGGMVLSPYTILNSTDIYTLGGAWASGPNLILGRAGHQQIVLPNSLDTVVIGGATTSGMATRTTEVLSTAGVAWTSGPTMNIPRTDFQVVQLSTGAVCALGGRTLGRGHDLDDNTLALWRFDELGGGISADATAAYPLTWGGVPPPTPDAQGKINGCLDFTVAGTYAAGAGDAVARSALYGEWTLEAWFNLNTLGDGPLIVYSGATEAETDNTLLSLTVDLMGYVTWKWENGAGVNVTQTSTQPLIGMPSYKPTFFNHLALVKSLNGMAYSAKVSGWAVGDLIHGQTSGAEAYVVSVDGGAPGAAAGTVRLQTANHLNFTVGENLVIIPVNNRTINTTLLTTAAVAGVSLYDVTLYVNGISIQVWTGQNNSTGGTTSTWNVARDLKVGGSNFDGRIDDIRISSRARSFDEVRQDFLNGWGGHVSPHLDRPIGAVTNTCEVVNGPSWAMMAPMIKARAFFKAVVLPGDYILVTGGLGYNPSRLPEYEASDSSYWPSQSLNDAEIWDPNTGRWSAIQPANIRRHGHLMEYNAARNEVVVMGGECKLLGGATVDDARRIEVLDIATKTWKTLAWRLIAARPWAVGAASGAEVVVMGGVTGAATTTFPEAYLYGGAVVASGGLNVPHRITAVPSGSSIEIETPAQAVFTTGYQTIFDYGDVTTGSRTSNVTTMVLGIPHTLAVGDYVFVNSLDAQFGSGLKLVTAVTATSFSYAETAGNQVSMAVFNNVSKSVSSTATLTGVSAPATILNAPGPIILDPIEGLAVTDTEALTTGFALSANQQYEELEINSDLFPDEEHYITLGFGTSNQTEPIKVLGKYKNAPSTTRLLLDYTYRFVNDFPVGSTVTLLASKAAFEPEDPLDIGSMWVTAASAGRVAAQAAAEEALAAGIDPDVTIVYPGDRGLGGEGLPAIGAQKLSDKVAVFAGDEIEEELALRREE